MNYIQDIARQKICLHGTSYDKNQLGILLDENPDSVIRQSLLSFLKEWYDSSDVIRVHTSGSTGIPKEILISKKQMIQSACMTCSFLELQPGDTALLCMSLQYIGAKMMVVRALVGQLDLILAEPTGHPLSDLSESVSFAAMVPLQVYNSLQVPEEKRKLTLIKRLIIGGGSIDTSLDAVLKSFPNPVFSTYGMTETVSHIAMRRLNGEEASSRYYPLPGIQLSLSEENTLRIQAPFLSDSIQTHDIVMIYNDGGFEIRGRKDLVINSGGIKIQTEELERKIRRWIDVSFAITSCSDEKFGETIVLLVESPVKPEWAQQLKKHLSPYEYPKHIIPVKNIPLTENGKTDRMACRRISETIPLE